MANYVKVKYCKYAEIISSSSKVNEKMGRIFELIISTFVLASFSNARQCDDGKIRGVNLGGWLLLGQKIVLFFKLSDSHHLS